MVSHYDITFAGPLPGLGAVVAQVSLNTGLNLCYDPVKGTLWSDELAVEVCLYRGETDYTAEPAVSLTIFDVFNYKVQYLLCSTLFVLTSLGGQAEDYVVLPPWAGLEWPLAKLLL